MKPESIEGISIQRFPASMTGKKLRKKLGIEENVYAKKTFKIKAKFRSIPVGARLKFLRNAEAKDYGIRLSIAELVAMRRGFDLHKIKHLGIAKGTKCWCCCNNLAVLRHHVQPLSKGGRNKANNIVPLCNDCHILVHPHMQRGRPKPIVLEIMDKQTERGGWTKETLAEWGISWPPYKGWKKDLIARQAEFSQALMRDKSC